MVTINQIVDAGLCCGCGTCAGVCPQGAVQMVIQDDLYVPQINSTDCTNCELCVKTCPGHFVDFEVLTKTMESDIEDADIGRFSQCFVGFSTDPGMRYDCASGGLVTQLLDSAFTENVIDGALVIGMKKDRTSEPHVFIARNTADLVSAAGSKYCPVAVNEALRQIFTEDGRFAVVGLPCHLHGVRKAESYYPILHKRIVLRLGLLCSHAVNFSGTEAILKKMMIRKEDVTELRYRGRGWPGFMSIRTPSGAKYIRLTGGWNAYWSMFSTYFFTPLRCAMCPDQTAELADISFGDAWLPEMRNDHYGTSIIVARTKSGERMLKLAETSKKIQLRAVTAAKVRQSQWTNLKFKKSDLGLRLHLLRALGMHIPTFTPKPAGSSSPVSLLRTLYVYLNIHLSTKKSIRTLLTYVPFPLFRLYYGLYKLLCMI
ncbi:MAG: Coenzyme F420 hydrogenase/dehydrogenase, beta subunit C-terminal domain [Candidatus Bathyarchaeota archaeon]|nr:MAG: Coenzyme F420 hydrogenase/dehydrogenase, beta subunit C-terminal domain [Candidatus Bathyarchaeota archaeon]